MKSSLTPAERTALTIRADATIRGLRHHQVQSLLLASRLDADEISDLKNSWEAVSAAEPELTAALDNVFEKGWKTDLPRFHKYEAMHRAEYADARKGERGRPARLLRRLAFIPALLASVAVVFWTAPLGLLAVGLAGSTLLLCVARLFLTRMHKEMSSFVFVDAEEAAMTTWSSVVDAAAAAILRHQPLNGGAHGGDLNRLGRIWSDAGCQPALLIPPVIPAQELKAAA